MLRKPIEKWRERRVTGTRSRGVVGDTQEGLSSQLAGALDCVLDAALIVDLRGWVVHANLAMEELLDLDGRALLGRPVEELLQGQASDDWFRQRSDSLRSFHAQVRIRRSTGEERADLQARPLHDGRGQATHYVLLPDTRMRGQPQEHANQSSTLHTLGRLAAELAHGMNNELSVVLNYAFVLSRQLTDRPELLEHVEELRAAAWGVSHRSRRLLRFGRRSTAELEAIDIHAELTRLQPLLDYVLRDCIELRIESEPKLRRARTSTLHLEQLAVELALRVRERLGSGKCLLRTANLELVPGASEAQQGLQAGRYVLFSLECQPDGDMSMAGSRESLPPSQDDDSCEALEHLIREAGGHFSWSQEEISARVLLPADE